MPRVKTLPREQKNLVEDKFPNFHYTGSITGMKRKFYGRVALLVRCDGYIYNVTSRPNIYERAR